MCWRSWLLRCRPTYGFELRAQRSRPYEATLSWANDHQRWQNKSSSGFTNFASKRTGDGLSSFIVEVIAALIIAFTSFTYPSISRSFAVKFSLD